MKCKLRQDSCVLVRTFSFMLRLHDIILLPRKRNREGRGERIYILHLKPW